MGTLFDRYFLVLSGRVTGVACGVVASPFTPTGGITLGWPLDFPEEPSAIEEKAAEAPSETDRSV